MLSPVISNTVLSLPSVELLEAGDFNLDELVDKLTGALADESQRNEILSLTGDTAVLVIECLDRIISSQPFRAKDIHTRSRVFSTISRLSRGCQYLPLSYWINPNTVVLANDAHTSGTCAEVHQGEQNGEIVAVKILRTSVQESPMVLKKRFCKEVIIWKHVSCPYVLKFKGVFYHNDVPAIVTPWMENGNITEYLEKNPDADRLRLLLCVVKGIKYLHSCNIAHGDIKAPNVLISGSTPPKALLADLGFTRVVSISLKVSSEEQGTVPFMAPELLLPSKFGLEKGVPTKEADIYALGATVYQVLTGKWPFFPKREAEIMHAVISGQRPPKPENVEAIGMPEVVWALLEESWRQDRTKRPDISKILGTFCDITGERKTTDSAMGMAESQLGDAGRRNSVDSPSRSSSLTTRSSSRGFGTDQHSSLSNTTAHSMSSYGFLDRDEISEAKEKNAPKQPTTKTSRSAKNRPDVGETPAGPGSPTETDQCTPKVHVKSKRKFVWDRVKRIKQAIVRSASL